MRVSEVSGRDESRLTRSAVLGCGVVRVERARHSRPEHVVRSWIASPSASGSSVA